ncbi:MAG: hypothetical protein HOQ44_04925 [Nocardia sp.]|nr:hypothetical protein [Nocardia sp.]
MTVRAELARLRRVLGYRLASDPYRLDPRIRCVFPGPTETVAAEGHQDISGLLPGSTAPGIQRLRPRIPPLCVDRDRPPLD